MDSSAPRLQLSDVVVRRGQVEILRGINFTFDPQVRHVLVGASGSGKSTLVRLLNRLDDPDGGMITLGGVPLANMPVLEVRRRIVVVAQVARPLPGTLSDNLVYPHLVRNQALPNSDHQAKALADVGLDPGWLDRDAAQLSGGERQRLAIAVALGIAPEILVLDEPTAALDSASARGIASLLDREARVHRLQTIVVTHDREIAPALGTWGVRLRAGVVVDQGPIQDVLDREETDGDPS